MMKTKKTELVRKPRLISGKVNISTSCVFKHFGIIKIGFTVNPRHA